MGLLQAGVGALSGVLADQWRDYFYCESIPAEVLITKGMKRKGKRSFNKKGSDNIISNGSIIAVNEGQSMIIVDQGKIVEFCSEPGEFVYDQSTEPSIFYGDLSASIKASFDAFGKRLAFGGEAGKDQRIYYFNEKEIPGNKYGTPTPIPFRVIDQNIGLDIDISIRCHGEYSFKIIDPILFYTNVSGNVEQDFRRTQIEGQLRSELLTALQPAFSRISASGIRYSALPGHTLELAKALNEILSDKWGKTRGIEIISFGINTVKASDEDEAMIKQLQKTAVLRNSQMAGATLIDAQSEAMKNAAKNDGGAMLGFAGLNFASQAGGVNAKDLLTQGNTSQKTQSQNQQLPPITWSCSCGAENTGKFCTECGTKKPEVTSWNCSCGIQNTGKFCTDCGLAKPKSLKCDKCGWVPKDPSLNPKFCPECGDVFDENDHQ
ncbi:MULTISPECIES: SPFH domain-containing protein [Lysinibacillus]|uniref:SPFH domain-containing protein n=1 Tax=Lysinibacillus antri TaxID=2498145 RepID=A0A3S0PNG3_9BACI|nr:MULTISPECIES: SPFH domain-containing protein [Lysinibacillus]RUL50511.1 SPFH domain-containing protein [Lysinibacillus antri]TSI07709.1 SPFH domain-containing protein [Lysinibacillus sp. BW-2-10]